MPMPPTDPEMDLISPDNPDPFNLIFLLFIFILRLKCNGVIIKVSK